MAKCVPGMPCYDNNVIIYTTYPAGCSTTTPSAFTLPLSSDDVYYSGPNLLSLDLDNGDLLTIALQKVDYFLSTFVPIVPGTGINYDSITGIITNTAPDQTVVLTQGTNVTITGSYPNFTINSPIIPVTKTSDFILANIENSIINNKPTTPLVVTLPNASLWPGRGIYFLNYTALGTPAIVSATASVILTTGGAAQTGITANIAGAWAFIVSDGTNWIQIASY